ncbi:MAG: ATP-dependent zinc metalloprotease FtsH [Candidatus Dojkabacteria bacterium]
MNENNNNSQVNSQKKADIRRMPKKKTSVWGIGVVVVILSMMYLGWSIVSEAIARGPQVDVSEIFQDIQSDKYSNVKLTVKDGALLFEGTRTREVDGKDVEVVERQFAEVSAGYSNRDLNADLKDYEISLKEVSTSVVKGSNSELIINILWLILLGVGIFMIYNMIKGMQAGGGKLMDFGQSQARLIFGKKVGVKFEDVAGIEAVKEELVEVVDFLKSPKKYLEIGARIPKGVLLVGAPGTGKTLLAKAVAGEAGVPFFHTSGSEFEEMLVGAGAARVRDLFKKAKRAAPCIIFIDEIDAVAKKRGTVLHSGAGEQTLNQILVEMDGLEERTNVIVLAATNRPDVLDPAILRPGRFDRNVTVQMPDYDGRLDIIKVHAKNKKFEKDVDFDVVAKKTIGYSGADIENLLNEAAIMAAKEGRKTISQSDLMESYLKVKLGRQKKGKKIDNDIERIAFHEAGHAVVAKLTPGAHPVEKISIISRGTSGGVTVYLPEDDCSLESVSQLKGMIASAVGGKVAEEVFFGEMTTGAGSDIRQVTEIARAMVQRYGMSEKLGFVKYGDMEEVTYLGNQYGGQRDFSEKTAQLIDEEIKRLIDEAQANARKLLKDNEAVVKKLVALLLEKEQVDREEFDALFEKVEKSK